MEVTQFQELIKRYHENREYITNEETAKMALVIPFIQSLGYDPNLPREVRMEYAADFTQADGKKYPDKMDIAIFDKEGKKPLMVIEVKQLGTVLKSKSQQLARYIAQMPDLRFGIITDGCHYLFYSDLSNPNQMDEEPFFNFALDDPKIDMASTVKDLTKFSRDAFNAETLITEAENSRYKLAMIDRISMALKTPSEDKSFIKWLANEIYDGIKTEKAMTRLGKIAREAIKPALMRVISGEFIEQLQHSMQRTLEMEGEDTNQITAEISEMTTEQQEENNKPKRQVVTTDEELDFYNIVKEMCSKEGSSDDDVTYNDTVNYFNILHRMPTFKAGHRSQNWFVRYFGDHKRKSVVTIVPTEEAKQLCVDFEIEDAPSVYGISRIYIDSVAQTWAIKNIILRSRDILLETRK